LATRLTAPLAGVCVALALSACDALSPSPTPRVIIIGGTPRPSATVAQAQYAPTTPAEPTVPPRLAARVNDQIIPLAVFETELNRNSAGIDANTEAGRQELGTIKDQVLKDLIERALIAQEAERNGIEISEQQIDEELAIARQRLGSDEAYTQWLTAQGLSPDDAREHIRLDLLANTVRDTVLATVPRQADYVHAFHILVATELEAQDVAAQLNAGAKLGPLAKTVSIDPTTSPDEGDLGWFAQNTGAILWPEVEAAAFALQPGDTSPIIKSPVGFHVIRVVGRETRPLTEADQAALEQRAFKAWLENLLIKAKVEIFV
jgi:parvulin-like peptidyl-prolyl isomerase